MLLKKQRWNISWTEHARKRVRTKMQITAGRTCDSYGSWLTAKLFFMALDTISRPLSESSKANHLRWLNTLLRAVSGNSREGVCFKLDKQTWRRKKVMVHRRQFLKICSLKFCDIWQNFYFYRTFNNKNFKMEVQQTNFVTLLIITVQSYYWLSKNPSVKIWSNSSLAKF